MAPDPLILTLALESGAQARFDALRRVHFPSERNFVPAHVTLFHALPGGEHPAVARDLVDRCGTMAPFDVRATGVRFLGRGVAYALESSELARLRGGLARAWAAWLGAQDQQGYRPHLTVQNKVAPETARTLHATLQAGFTPFDIRATGLVLWHYRGGPWDEAGQFAFTGPARPLHPCQDGPVPPGMRSHPGE